MLDSTIADFGQTSGNTGSSTGGGGNIGSAADPFFDLLGPGGPADMGGVGGVGTNNNNNDMFANFGNTADPFGSNNNFDINSGNANSNIGDLFGLSSNGFSDFGATGNGGGVLGNTGLSNNLDNTNSFNDFGSLGNDNLFGMGSNTNFDLGPASSNLGSGADVGFSGLGSTSSNLGPGADFGLSALGSPNLDLSSSLDQLGQGDIGLGLNTPELRAMENNFVSTPQSINNGNAGNSGSTLVSSGPTGTSVGDNFNLGGGASGVGDLGGVSGISGVGGVSGIGGLGGVSGMSGGGGVGAVGSAPFDGTNTVNGFADSGTTAGGPFDLSSILGPGASVDLQSLANAGATGNSQGLAGAVNFGNDQFTPQGIFGGQGPNDFSNLPDPNSNFVGNAGVQSSGAIISVDPSPLGQPVSGTAAAVSSSSSVGVNVGVGTKPNGLEHANACLKDMLELWCEPTAEWTSLKGIRVWCNSNCPLGSCDASRCACSCVPPAEFDRLRKTLV